MPGLQSKHKATMKRDSSGPGSPISIVTLVSKLTCNLGAAPYMYIYITYNIYITYIIHISQQTSLGAAATFLSARTVTAVAPFIPGLKRGGGGCSHHAVVEKIRRNVCFLTLKRWLIMVNSGEWMVNNG